MCLRRWECACCWVSEGLKLTSEAVPRAGSEVRICAGGAGQCLVAQGSWGASGVTCPALTHQAHERLEETKLEAVRDNNLELVQEILRDLAQLAEQSSTAAELARILQEPHFQVPARRGRGAGSWGGGWVGPWERGWRGVRATGHCPTVLPVSTASPVPPGDTRLCGLENL